MNRYLVTGGNGFIGSHLVDRLLADGNQVIVIGGKTDNLTPRVPLTIYKESILGDIGHLFEGIDVVFHLAALTRPQWSIKYPVETDKVNVNGTVKVLQHCVDNKVKRIVFASTSNLYGDQDLYPTPENVEPHPMNAYALSKWIGEQYCKLFETVYGLEWNAIRPFNAYGERMPLSGYYTSAVATFIDVLKNDKPLTMFGDGEQRRDFIYVSDIVDQMILMAHSQVYGEAFNCGSGTNTSINEVLDLICKIMGKKIIPTRLPAQFEPKGTLADISKAERLLGWKPRISLKEGLERTIYE